MRPAVESTQDGRDELAERRGELTGPLRLSAPVSFGCLQVAPALISFMKQHPGIAASLEFDDRFVDIVSGGFDAVIRHGTVGDGSLVAHRLAPGGRVLIASPAHLATHGEPRSLEALQGHRAILYSHRETDWRLQTAGGVRVVRPTAGLPVNNVMRRSPALASPCFAAVHCTPGIAIGRPQGAQRRTQAGRRRPQHRVPARPHLISKASRSQASSPLSLRQPALLGNSSRRGARLKPLHR
jgi:DNA-binding transcriptional LysR family regulator